jgi:hypothetical protein
VALSRGWGKGLGPEKKENISYFNRSFSEIGPDNEAQTSQEPTTAQGTVSPPHSQPGNPHVH